MLHSLASYQHYWLKVVKVTMPVAEEGSGKSVWRKRWPHVSAFCMYLYILYVAMGTCGPYTNSTQLWSKPKWTGTGYSKKVHHTPHQDCWHLLAAGSTTICPSNYIMPCLRKCNLTQYNKLYSNLICSITWHRISH